MLKAQQWQQVENERTTTVKWWEIWNDKGHEDMYNQETQIRQLSWYLTLCIYFAGNFDKSYISPHSLKVKCAISSLLASPNCIATLITKSVIELQWLCQIDSPIPKPTVINSITEPVFTLFGEIHLQVAYLELSLLHRDREGILKWNIIKQKIHTSALNKCFQKIAFKLIIIQIKKNILQEIRKQTGFHLSMSQTQGKMLPSQKTRRNKQVMMQYGVIMSWMTEWVFRCYLNCTNVNGNCIRTAFIPCQL